MDIGNFVMVTNKYKNLYRRRCRITDIIKDSETTKYMVYSEGLDEDEMLQEEDIEVSQY